MAVPQILHFDGAPSAFRITEGLFSIIGFNFILFVCELATKQRVSVKIDFRVILSHQTHGVDIVGEDVLPESLDEIPWQESNDGDKGPAKPVGSRTEKENIVTVHAGVERARRNDRVDGGKDPDQKRAEPDGEPDPSSPSVNVETREQVGNHDGTDSLGSRHFVHVYVVTVTSGSGSDISVVEEKVDDGRLVDTFEDVVGKSHETKVFSLS